MRDQHSWVPVALLAVAGVLAAAVALADAPRRWRPPPRPSVALSVTLEGVDGAPLRTFQRHGQSFVLGVEGRRYNVRVVNHSGRRLEAVIAVDGRDAVSGQRVNAVQQRGYIVPAFGSLVVEGFRTSLSEVAAFRFSSPQISFAGRLGAAESVGLIRVAAFVERRQDAIARAPASARPAPKRKAAQAGADAAESRTGARRDEAGNLGTKFGERHSSRVVEVPFERQNPGQPDRIVTIAYDDARGLRARGIEVDGHGEDAIARALRPQQRSAGRFATPPP
jgi:hypothetical protein